MSSNSQAQVSSLVSLIPRESHDSLEIVAFYEEYLMLHILKVYVFKTLHVFADNIVRFSHDGKKGSFPVLLTI